MAEKCLLAASMAILICHPRTSINCFNHKQTLNPQKQKYIYPNPKDIQNQNQPNSEKKPENSDQQVASTRSKLDIPSPLMLRAQKEVSASSLCSVFSLAQGGCLFHSVKNIFVMGWDQKSSPKIEQILVVNHGVDAVNKFEEYREMVKLRAAAREKRQMKKLTVDGNEFKAGEKKLTVDGNEFEEYKEMMNIKKQTKKLTVDNEHREMVKLKAATKNLTVDGNESEEKKQTKKKLTVDGNEFLAFHGAVVTCSLGINGVSRTCDKKRCGLCIMMNMVLLGAEENKSKKKKKMKMKSIRFNENSWRAHQKVALMECGVNGRKAIAMCRVIAGRIGHDSVMSDAHKGEELIVFNPTSVLPSFVVIYNVT